MQQIEEEEKKKRTVLLRSVRKMVGDPATQSAQGPTAFLAFSSGWILFILKQCVTWGLSPAKHSVPEYLS